MPDRTVKSRLEDAAASAVRGSRQSYPEAPKDMSEATGGCEKWRRRRICTFALVNP